VLGRFLFRWRGAIGVLAFGVVFWVARPTFGSCLIGLPFVVLGLAVRFWASGYIGIAGRVREIGGRGEVIGRSERLEARGESAALRDGRREEGRRQRRIVSGPYRTLRHPLYIGNFMLVAGMLAALRPPLWLSVAVVAGFVLEYGLIIGAEEAYLAGRGGSAECKMQKAKGKMEDGQGGGNADCRLQNAEGKVEDKRSGGSVDCRMQNAGCKMGESEGRSEKREARSRSAELRMAVSGRREAEGGSFSLRRAMCEWRTWVVTGVAWGLAMAKALSGR
jgi:hypothetical protein